jgi:hypothetical protein
MTCPEMRFVEWDFFRELPFLIEKDPELLKQAGWLLRLAREINKTIGVGKVQVAVDEIHLRPLQVGDLVPPHAGPRRHAQCRFDV